jgi:RNase P subunit RPR2
MPEHIINFDNKAERNKFLKHCLRNKITCQLCDNNSFKVEYNSPEEIILTCINCGWVHIINNGNLAKNKVQLKFPNEEEK